MASTAVVNLQVYLHDMINHVVALVAAACCILRAKLVVGLRGESSSHRLRLHSGRRPGHDQAVNCVDRSGDAERRADELLFLGGRQVLRLHARRQVDQDVELGCRAGGGRRHLAGSSLALNLKGQFVASA